MFSTFALQRPSTLPSPKQTSSPLSSSTFRNCSRLSNFGFIERHFRPRTGFIRQLDFSQSRHMGFATIWRKRRRLRRPIALQQAFLAKRMSNRLDLWRLLGDLGSNTLRRFDAIRYIRSRDFPHAALYILHRIATHLPEPHHQACVSAIRSSLRFRGLIPPSPSRPMLAPFFAHCSFRTLLLTQLRGFVRPTTRSALPFHVAQPRIVFKAHRKLSQLWSPLSAIAKIMRAPDSCSIAPPCTARCWTPHSRILPSLLPCESPPLRSINGNEKASSADSAVAIHEP